jgi:hypothetical protein
MKKNIPLYILFIIFIILSIFDTEKLTNNALDALSLWGLRIVPALFPFLFCTKALLLLGIDGFFNKTLGGLFGLLGLPKKGAYPFCVSLLGGYPAGAAALGQMVELKIINDDECAALAPLCHTSGPIFILGYAANVTGYDGSMLLICHISGVLLCALTVQLFKVFSKKRTAAEPEDAQRNKPDFSFAGGNDVYPSPAIGELLSKACSQSISTILHVGGFIVFFACFTAFLPVPDLIKGLFEMTNGLKMGFSAPYCAFLLSFSGLCINLQALALLPKKIQPMKFIGCRLLSGVFSAIFCAISQACSLLTAVPVMAVCIFALAGCIIWRTGRDCALPARRSLQGRFQAPQERR